ncbi:hypothetical protein A5725_12065 [Mycobacterium kubicae]|nr:hypothetical protein A5725_12065 [Mycobacterium kubicae]
MTLTARTSLPELLAALAAAVPPLPGAHCRGHTRLFDTTIGHAQKVDTREARAAALGLCATCPALDPCRAWLDRLPDHHRPTGVVAGQIINPAIPANPRKKATP